MDERHTGLILRTRPCTETSLIVHWLTPELGRLATIAKGARRPKSPLRGKLDLFFLADFSFQRSRRSDLHTLREVNVREFNPALRQNLLYLQQASYFAHVLEQTTETETPLPVFFEILSQALRILPHRPPQALTVFAFEIKLLKELGLIPRFGESRLSDGTREILAKLAEADWTTLSRIRLSAAQTDEIAQFLGGFLGYHLEKVPAGRALALGLP